MIAAKVGVGDVVSVLAELIREVGLLRLGLEDRIWDVGVGGLEAA